MTACSTSSPCRAQRGVALITALLVVAIAASTAIALASTQQVAIQRSANILNGEQAYQYVIGAEAFASLVLRRDREEDAVDHLNEGWATLLPPTTLDEGTLFGRLEDLQARFNLNNLVGADGVAAAVQVAQFERLLGVLELPTELAWNVVDWIDGDQEPSPGRGAEDLEYLRRDPAYRSAGRPLTSPSELLLIDGFDMASYQRLEAHVTALPQPTAINVNTASAEVLQSLSDPLSPALVEALIDGREQDGYPDTATFLATLRNAEGNEAGEGLQGSVSVGSNFFLFSGEARFGRGRAELNSLLQRDAGGRVTTLRRSRGPL
jgi:general secretion pathway protein K